MVLHHLRGEQEWSAVFQKLHRALKPGGSLWISDLVDHTIDEAKEMLWERYGEYLIGIKGAAHRDEVFEYVAREDSPRTLLFQTALLKDVGFDRRLLARPHHLHRIQIIRVPLQLSRRQIRQRRRRATRERKTAAMAFARTFGWGVLVSALPVLDRIDVLHANTCFAVFGGIKARA